MSVSFIISPKNGYSIPDIETLCKLAKIFGVTLDELVEYSEENE